VVVKARAEKLKITVAKRDEVEVVGYAYTFLY
jgi:hypothetical protein